MDKRVVGESSAEVSKVMDGKSLSESMLELLQKRIAEGDGVRPPKLIAILVGDDYASKQYIQMKTKVAHRIGAELEVCTFDGNAEKALIVDRMYSVCADPSNDGVMVQLPLPVGIDTESVLDCISIEKDVDGLTSLNLGLLMNSSKNATLPATIAGVMKLLSHYGVEPAGKRVVIVGKGRGVGLPLFAKLNSVGATATMCDITTVDLKAVCREADILLSATGSMHLIGPDHVKEGAVLFDIGVSRDPVSGKIAGDIDYEAVYDKCSHITPVPGGVGPMTIACLMENLVDAWRRNLSKGVAA